MSNLNQALKFLPAALILAGCAQKPVEVATSGKAAATVNGEQISLDDFYEHMMAKQTAQVLGRGGAAEERVVGSFGLQALQEVVDQRILLQMAKEQGVSPTEADVDAEIKFQQSLRPDYLTVLQDQGVSLPLIRNEVKVGIAREHLLMKGITVEPAEVDKYIKEHPEKFGKPEKATVLMIQAGSEAAKQKAEADLTAGKAFGVVAGQYSRALGAKENGGAYPTDEVSRMPKPLQDIVHKTAVGKTSDWIKDGPAFFKFLIKDKTAGTVVAPTAPQRELVKRELAMAKGTAKNEFGRIFMEKLKTAKVDVAIASMKTPWDKSWNQLAGSSTAPVPANGK